MNRRGASGVMSCMPIGAFLLTAALAASPDPAAVRTVVIAAPGYPGTTADAQGTLDAFAAALAAAAGLPSGSVGAVYHNEEEAGVARLREPDAVLALVPLPFYLKHRGDLSLRPVVEVAAGGGTRESWSLVAAKGKLASASALEGWEVTGPPGYAPAFIRGPVLGRWGELPAGARVTFTPRPLSALRRAAGGEPVAVVLDGAQTEALSALPFASDLEVVHRSGELPGSVVCVVGDRLAPDEEAKFVSALLGLASSEEGAQVLGEMRIERFAPLEKEPLEAARKAYEAAR